MSTDEKVDILMAVAIEMDKHLAPVVARMESLERRLDAQESRLKQLSKEHAVLGRKLAELEAKCQPS